MELGGRIISPSGARHVAGLLMGFAGSVPRVVALNFSSAHADLKVGATPAHADLKVGATSARAGL